MQTKQSKTKKPAAPAAARQDSLETPAAFPPDSLIPPDVMSRAAACQDSLQPPCPGDMDEATKNGIEIMARELTEQMEYRIRDMISAAVKTGAKEEYQPAAARMAGIMIDGLAQEAARLIKDGLESHFSGLAPFADNVPGNYFGLL